ncbi:MAG TPA: GNAT family N-acetyltransferase [Nocardioides sp.]|uniref:GNAT family N-acetyltransferase n=1 Tax=Nocardioides sp. TaxID=35761 RepID=UPI002F3EF29C
MPADLRIEQVPITHPDARVLVDAVQQEYVVRYGGPDHSPLVPDDLAPPSGAFYVGYLDDAPVATGAWRFRDDVERLGSTRPAEVKRMYVAPSARRQALAHLMLAHLEDSARAAGADVMILETGTAQPEAMELYVGAGYEPVEPFGHYRWSPQNRCYARRLG